MGGPATVDGQDDAGDMTGLRVGEQERGAGEFLRRGPAAEGDIGGKETPHLRIDLVTERGGASGGAGTRNRRSVPTRTIPRARPASTIPRRSLSGSDSVIARRETPITSACLPR